MTTRHTNAATARVIDPSRLRHLSDVIVFEAHVVKLTAMPLTMTLAVPGHGDALHPFDVVVCGREEAGVHPVLAPFRGGTLAVVVGPREAGGAAVRYGGVLGLDVELLSVAFDRERPVVPGTATWRVTRLDGRPSATLLAMPLAADEMVAAAAYFTRRARLTVGAVAA